MAKRFNGLLAAGIGLTALAAYKISTFGTNRIIYEGDTESLVKAPRRSQPEMTVTFWIRKEEGRRYTVMLEGMEMFREEGGAYDRYSFTMPRHDVHVSISAVDISITADGKPLLADYFWQRTAADDEPYYELVLYEYDDEHLLLEEYDNGGAANEIVTPHLVSRSTYDEVLTLARRYRMERWERQAGESLDGVKEVVKVRVNGKVIRVSSESIPQGCGRAMNEVKNVLRKHLKDR
ncbi:MAG: hypothetical protein IJI05_00350 [Erysipelotrichaceae bacterium]|nr:hypothetical protein [Erysipelotrichaceae bacterium]